MTKPGHEPGTLTCQSPELTKTINKNLGYCEIFRLITHINKLFEKIDGAMQMFNYFYIILN